MTHHHITHLILILIWTNISSEELFIAPMLIFSTTLTLFLLIFSQLKFLDFEMVVQIILKSLWCYEINCQISCELIYMNFELYCSCLKILSCLSHSFFLTISNYSIFINLLVSNSNIWHQESRLIHQISSVQHEFNLQWKNLYKPIDPWCE